MPGASSLRREWGGEALLQGAGAKSGCLNPGTMGLWIVAAWVCGGRMRRGCGAAQGSETLRGGRETEAGGYI